jgi:hypothetical protein
MPASQAGRHGFDPRRPLQLFPLKNIRIAQNIQTVFYGCYDVERLELLESSFPRVETYGEIK